MNIGIFTDTYFPQINGVVTSIQMLRNELIKKGHSVYVFTTTDPNITPDCDDGNVFRLPSMPFVFFPERRIAYIYPPNLLLKLKKLNLDIVHTQTEFSLGFFGKAVSELNHIPLIHTYHTMYEDYVHYVANGHLVTPNMAKKFSKFFCNRANRVVTPTEKSKHYLIEYGVLRPIHVIPTGLDFDHFKKTNFTVSDIQDLKKELDININDPIILSLGRISKEKSVDVIIKFMPALIQKIPNIKLVLVGDGPMLSDLKTLAQTLNVKDSVLFLGNKPWDEIGKYYQLGDVFVSASESETQGLTYIEAILSKIPLLVKEDESLSGIIENGKNGFMFKDESDFINYCSYLLSDTDLRKSFSENAYEQIQSLSSDTFAERILELYNETIEDYNLNPTLRKMLIAKFNLDRFTR